LLTWKQWKEIQEHEERKLLDERLKWHRRNWEIYINYRERSRGRLRTDRTPYPNTALELLIIRDIILNGGNKIDLPNNPQYPCPYFILGKDIVSYMGPPPWTGKLHVLEAGPSTHGIRQVIQYFLYRLGMRTPPGGYQ
jgi:hypothetical protein